MGWDIVCFRPRRRITAAGVCRTRPHTHTRIFLTLQIPGIADPQFHGPVVTPPCHLVPTDVKHRRGRVQAQHAPPRAAVGVAPRSRGPAQFFQLVGQEDRHVGRARRQVQHRGAGRQLQLTDHPSAPRRVEVEGEDAVHEVVAGGDAVEHGSRSERKFGGGGRLLP